MAKATGGEVAHIVVRGRVQGVGFRAWIHHQAELRGLDGWVRNRRDGSVEALFRGDAQVVRAMLEVCRKGPSVARVDAVEPVEGADPFIDDAAPGSGFKVLRTV